MSSVPPKIALAVDTRDKQRCVRCGVWIQNNGSRHHRMRRAAGGHVIANIILLCGSGTTGCHGWVHANPAEARADGLIVRSTVLDITRVPLKIVDHDLSPRPVFVLLTDDQRVQISEDEALALLEEAA